MFEPPPNFHDLISKYLAGMRMSQMTMPAIDSEHDESVKEESRFPVSNLSSKRWPAAINNNLRSGCRAPPRPT